MQYAIHSGRRLEASPGLEGHCPYCDQLMIARCGELKVWHWAHKGRRNCDPWWEAETAWHRNWKAMFPSDWQEVIQFDEETGEKHIADVKTSSRTVIEFQHSFIKPEERHAREKFYKHMIWVVDGTRLKNDFPRFQKAIPNWKEWLTRMRPIHFPDEIFPKVWISREVPVVFDWGMGNDFVWLHPRDTNEPQQLCWKLDRETLMKFLTLNWTDLTKIKSGPEQPRKSPTVLPFKASSSNHFLRKRSKRL